MESSSSAQFISNNICAIKSTISLEMKCPQLSKPETTAARTKTPSVTERRKNLGRNQARSGGQFPSGQTNQQFVSKHFRWFLLIVYVHRGRDVIYSSVHQWLMQKIQQINALKTQIDKLSLQSFIDDYKEHACIPMCTLSMLNNNNNIINNNNNSY